MGSGLGLCVCRPQYHGLASMGFVFSFGIFFPVFMDYFQESREKTAWVGSLGIALIFFGGLGSGALVNRFGCRVTTLLGGFFCALSLGLSSLATNIGTLYFTYSVLFGLGTSCVFSANLNIISKYFKKRLSLAIGIVTCGQGGGVLILAPLLQTMIDAYSWQTTYRIMAGVVPALLLSGLTFSPNVISEDDAENTVVEADAKTSSAGDARNEQEVHEKASEIEEKKEGCLFYVSVWKESKFVATVLSASVMMFGHYVPQIHLVRYCEDIGITADAASRLFVYYGIASCVGRLVSGRLCDFEKVNTFYVYQVSELIAGTSILVVTMATSYVHMVVFIVIYGLCDGAFITTLNVLLMTCVSPQKVPIAIGWEMQISSFFLASGPPVAGLMADSLNSYTHAFYMAGAVVLAGACIPFLLLFAKSKEPGEEMNELMNPHGGQETGMDPGTQETSIAFTSSL
ncbi:hypothetical protein OS493_006128 [Desmophyllum pertusum]|uniref:Major facilitator superfamily (MFS) profile domain-containing protein n=1 Tax=Desmophyllum pertusum TaxID=174260 RepID=A0A9X0DAA6_9CNID|nr:hypothetical protein OS493_006128 [Desmophyllum pertusum]